MQEYFINKNDLLTFVASLLKDAVVAAPVAFKDRNVLEEITPETVGAINLYGYRTVEPFKSYLFRLTEKVSSYFGKDEPTHGKKLVLLGARGCDLEALEVYDKVFGEGEFTDPQYLANRKDIMIIGADCTACGQTCFCTMVNGNPFPQKLFDLNLSPIDDGYVVEVGTDKGRKIVEANASLFVPADKTQLEKKINIRGRVLGLLEEINKDFKCRCTIGWADAHKLNLENKKAWKVVTKDCVECSGCNFICPTCTCFLLLDERGTGKGEREADESSRYKVWDACLKAGYARVAGGANSRPKLFERLQNRYHCKFDYSHDRLGRYTCVGCGRCLDGCAGNIDMRKVYAELVRQAPLTAKLE